MDVFRLFFKFKGYFGNFLVSGVFRSFFRFEEYFGNFRAFKYFLRYLSHIGLNGWVTN